MAHETAVENKQLQLPVSVAGPVEIGRLIREVEEVSEKLLQLGLRHAGTKVKMPQTSHLLDQVVELNELNLLHSEDREALKKFLTTVHDNAPVLHMSFSADPAPAFVEKLMAWLRQEIDPQVLLTIGLQPNLGAGCVVRGTNHLFDLSLKQDFIKKRGLLTEKLKALQQGAQP